MKAFTTNIPPKGEQSPMAANSQDDIDRRTAELLCKQVRAGRTITPDELLANSKLIRETTPQDMPLVMNASDPEEGELLRLTSEVQTLVRGASPNVLKKLGMQRLTDLKKFINDEQDALKTAATQVKAAINSALTVNELMALGMNRLRELGAKHGVKVGPSDPWADYSINAIIDEVLKSGAGGDSKPGGGDEFDGYSLNDHLDAAKKMP